MSDKVISLAERRAAREESREHDPHLSGPARCMQCSHQWVAVAPVGTVWLECPACHCVKGVFEGAVGPGQDDAQWRCACGGYLFYISKAHGVCCCQCGKPATGWF
ncbi:MAG: hypothetical protein ACREVL_16525 [Solimonas sp.]